MARTKQTARKALVNFAPRKKLIANPKTKKNKKNIQINESQSENEEVVNNQQFSIKFDDQAKCQQQCINGIMIYCRDCEAILTSQSKIYGKKQYENIQKTNKLTDSQKQKFLKNIDKVWICQFCLSHNKIPKNYQVPKIENPCYLIEKAKKKQINKEIIEEENSQNKILIFCIDISTSMNFIVANNKTRLDIVKEAIIGQIDKLKMEQPKLKVGIILFGSQVVLIGDATNFKQKNLPEFIYNDFDAIIKESQKIKNFCVSLDKSFTKLRKRINQLSYYGSTALGPALLASIQLSSKGAIGSKVIICTDGQANVGIGGSTWGLIFSFGNTQIPPSLQLPSKFYQKAAQFAKKKRVSVSCLSLKGDNCNLKDLGKLSLQTNGSLLKIDPRTLGTQFSKITKQQILGTDCLLKIKVNKIFQIISSNPSELSSDRTTLTRDYGNFTADSELTFQFNVIDKQHASHKPEIDMQLYLKQKVPMQIQLRYVGRDQNVYMQIITDWRQLTQNQNQLYDGANFTIFAANVLQKASSKIRNKQFKQAQSIFKGYWSIVKEKFQKQQQKKILNSFNDRVKKLEAILNSKLKKSNQTTNFKSNIKLKQTKVKEKKSKKVIKSKKGSLKTNNKKQQSSQSQDQDDIMSSDEQQQILCKQMRARS